MVQIKIIKTEEHTDSQGKHIVKRGRLILLRNDGIYPEDGMIGSNNVHPLFMWTHLHTNGIRNTTLLEYLNTALIQPIIVSDDEPIQIGEITPYLITWKNGIKELVNTNNSISDLRIEYSKKVLALPEHFSPKHLQAIVDGKIKDGDEVLVECEEMVSIPLEHLLTGSDVEIEAKKHPFNVIKLNQSNHIKLFRVDKVTTWENPTKIMERFIKDNPKKFAEIIAKVEAQEHSGPTVNEYFASFGNTNEYGKEEVKELIKKANRELLGSFAISVNEVEEWCNKNIK